MLKEVRLYLFDVLDDLLDNNDYQINVNFLDKGNYSVDRLPVDKIVKRYINGEIKYREVYEFRSMKSYSQDVMTNLNNIGFFEDFERVIESNNNNKILPNGVESIKCLNAGSLAVANPSEAIFSIQIEVQYRDAQEELSI